MIIDFLESYEDFLYGCIAVLALWYLRSYLVADHQLRIGAYIVERETAIREKMKALSILIVLAGLLSLVYLELVGLCLQLIQFYLVRII